MKFKLLDLFSGIGGFSLGLERSGYFETVAFCEIEPFPRAVLKKHWPKVHQYDDVRTLTRDRLVRDGITVNAICGGFPCQDISTAGKKAGISGLRSGLWREYFRIIRELRPEYAIVENASALLHRGMGVVLGDLASIGFNAIWYCIPASDIGAPHGRDRAWIAAYPDKDRKPSSAEHDEACGHENVRQFEDAKRGFKPLEFYMARAWRQQQSLPWDRVWPNENSPLGMGVDDGIPQRLDRLRSLGNAVVPQIPEIIGRAIGEYEKSPN